MKLRLNQITRDIKLSPRDETNTETVKEYSERFAKLPPIVVYKLEDRKKYLLVDGWHRYAAAEMLKLEEVEVVAHYGTWAQATEYAMLANLKHGLPLTRKERRRVITEFLKLHPERSNNWIAGDLGVDTKTVIAIREKLEAGLEFPTLEVLTGKDGKEYPRTIEQPKQEKEETSADPDEEDAEQEPEPISVPMIGIYELNRVHCVDCIEGLAGLPEDSVDLVFSDPPYNLGKSYGQQSTDKLPPEDYFSWCTQWFLGAYRALKPGGAFYVMHYPEIAAKWKQQLDLFFTFQRWISWVYPSNVGHSRSNWQRSHRAVLYYIKGEEPAFFDGNADPQPYKNPDDRRVAHKGKEGTTPYDWWEYNLVKNVSQDKTPWPNQLPVELVRRIVVSSCPPDGTVCDPHMGSGTTAVAAGEAGRDWIGFDIEAQACEITTERVNGQSG